MSIAPTAAEPQLQEPEADAPPRVRHQARDAAALMVFSAATSAGIAVFFLLLAVAARQA